MIEITDRFCAEQLDAEYRELCRRLIARLARKRPSPLERGEPLIWAAGAVYELGSANFLFDRSCEPFMTGDQFAAALGVAWLVAVDGFIVDARQLPPELQAEARRQGLIPHITEAAWAGPVTPSGGSARRPTPPRTPGRRR
jgi:hypothetical protein